MTIAKPPVPYADDVETLSLILMGDDNADDFNKALLYIAFCSILKKANTTLAQITDELSSFGVDEQKVLRVLSQLCGANAIGKGCVSKWKVPRSGVIHYNYNRKRCFEFEMWMDRVEQELPALVSYRPFRVTARPSRVELPTNHRLTDIVNRYPTAAFAA